MSNNFLDTIGQLKKDDISSLLQLYKYYPEKSKSEAIRAKGFRDNLGDWFKGINYYNPKSLKTDLSTILQNIVKKKAGVNRNIGNLEASTKIVKRIASKEKIPQTGEMTVREIENALFESQAESSFPSYLLAVKCMVYIAMVDTSRLDKVRTQIIDTFINSLLVTKQHKVELHRAISRKPNSEDIKSDVAELKKDKKVNTKQVFSAILGFIWCVALADQKTTSRERRAFELMRSIFNIDNKLAVDIRVKVEENFRNVEKIVAQELRCKENLVDQSSTSAAMAGAAGSIVVLGLAESTGFGLFLFATSALHAIGLLVGVTFPFAAYTTLTTILGILTGPVGWIGIPVLIAGSILVSNLAKSPGDVITSKLIVRVAYLRGDL
jgi:hypothetical protein